MSADHAELSPSSAHRWLSCPGSVALCRGRPDTSSAAAKEGTHAHEIAAAALKTRAPVEVGGEMAEHLDGYVEAVCRIADGRPIYVEEAVRVNADVYGTADVIIPGPTLDVVDLKYGAGIRVEVENNPQFAIYALGAMKRLLEQDDVRVKDVAMHCYQPRHYAGGHTTWQVKAAWLWQWERDVLDPGVAATKAPDAPLVPGDHCTFCQAKADCPALEKQTLDLLDDGPPAPVSMPPEKLAAALAVFPQVEAWIKAVRDAAYERARNGETIPGYKLVKSFGHRTWDDPEAAEAWLSLVVEDETKLRPPGKLISPAQAEKLLTKRDKDVVSYLCSKPERGASLVPDASRGDAPADPAVLFDELD